MKKMLNVSLVFMLLASTLCTSCGKQAQNSNLNTSETVTLTLCGPWTEWKAIESVSQKFTEKYPNCTIEYEYLQNYDESIVTRLDSSPDTVDLFLCQSIQEGSDKLPYALELFSQKGLDLSDTNEALIKNYTYKNADTEAEKQIYAIPLGGEIRGLYVNKTLLQSVGLEVPANREELLTDCQTLLDAGYIPMNGNPGVYGQRLMYPYVCNLIANSDDYDATYQRVNDCEEGVSELFREPMKLLYEMTEKGYYNYKYVETQNNMFIDTSDEGQARDFFHIIADGDDYKKVDDIGTVAFLPGTLAQNTTMEKIKEDYHSEIDYEFILAPVCDEGGFAYVSPAKGIAVNKNSSNVDWAVEFIDFLFEKNVNQEYAKEDNYIPNIEDSFDNIQDTFEVPKEQISDLGQATFDYDFYGIINDSMINITKANNPKYMDVDEKGNPVMYSFDYYMNQLEAAFAAQRGSGAE